VTASENGSRTVRRRIAVTLTPVLARGISPDYHWDNADQRLVRVARQCIRQHEEESDLKSTLTISTSLQDLVPEFPNGRVTILPSSLRAVDPLAGAIQALCPHSVVFVSRTSARSRRVAIAHPAALLRAVRLPEMIATAEHLICAVDLDEVATSGPFVLDLLARCVSPLDRARILASRQRAARVAEVNLAKRIDVVIMSRTVDNERVFVATSDLIAGELAALTMSENEPDAKSSLQTPWEDAVVQRATEFELGARYPGDMLIENRAGTSSSAAASITAAFHLRIGIDF
jgi:hypothetical protein